MADNHRLIVAILAKYALKQPLSEAETRLLEEWQSRSGEHRALPDQLRDPQWREEYRKVMQDAPTAAMWENIRRHIKENPDESRLAYLRQRNRRVAMRCVAAAALIGVVVFVGRPIWRRMQGADAAIAQPAKNGLLLAATKPSDNDDDGARITLSDGRVIPLDSAPQGATFSENGFTMTRTEDGIAYTNSPADLPQPLDHRTEPQTPKGITAIANQVIKDAMYVLTLGKQVTRPFCVGFPDGSKIWLNLTGKLTYPGDLRAGRVTTLEGEAWFDIAKDSLRRQLKIKTGKGQEVTVLGTSFNLRTYPNEMQFSMEVYSGKVRAKSNEDSVVVQAGSVAMMMEGKRPEVKMMTNHLPMPAWMAYFEFRNTPLPVALKEVASWYSMNLSNPYNVNGIPITGKLPRSQSPENTLHALERAQSGQAFLRRKGNTILIIPGDAGP